MVDKLQPKNVKELWQKGQAATRKAVNDYWLNSVFLADEQWSFLNAHTQRLQMVPRRDPERVRLVMNVLRPRTRGILTRLTAQPLVFRVRPQAADDETVQGAGTAEMVLDHYHEMHDWEMLRDEQANVTWIGGTSALMLEWDPTAGEGIVDPQSRVPLSRPNGKKLYTGDICASILSVPEFTVTPGSRNAERAAWCIKACALPPEQVKQMYGLAKTPDADAGAMLSPELWRMDSSTGDSTEARQNLTAVYTYYERPSQESDGQVLVVVGNTTVDESPWPFPFKDRLNIFVARETFVHGRWTGDTILTTARTPQVALNQVHSSIVEHMKRAGNARTWVPNSAVDDIEDLTDEPGEFVEYEASAGKPLQVSPPQMPSWWSNQPGMLTALIDEMLGSVEVSRGVAPRNVESGLGLSILSENANSPLTQLAKEQARTWSRFATCALQTLEANVTEPREAHFAEVPDLALPADTLEWTGESFRGQTTAAVPVEAIQPRSEAQQRAWADTAYQAGAISLRAYSRIIQVPGQSEMEAIADPDSSRAQRENYLMAQGRDCAVELWDDDQKHVDILNDYRKSTAFERLDPKIKAMFQAHAEAHEQSSINKQAQAAERTAAAPGLGAAVTAHGGPTGLPVPPDAMPGAPTAPTGGPPPPGGPPSALPTTFNPNDISPEPVTGNIPLPQS